MANQLITPGGEIVPQPEDKTMSKPKKERVQRCFLYSADCPEGRIFEGADAIAEANEDGWLDSPAKLEVAKPKAEVKSGGAKKATKNGNNRK